MRLTIIILGALLVVLLFVAQAIPGSGIGRLLSLISGHATSTPADSAAHSTATTPGRPLPPSPSGSTVAPAGFHGPTGAPTVRGPSGPPPNY